VTTPSGDSAAGQEVTPGLGSYRRGATEPESAETDPAQCRISCATGLARLIYTSGTTGLPKGVMLTNHRNLLFLAAVISQDSLADSATIASIGILPMSHAVGLSVVLLGSLLSGATLYLVAAFRSHDGARARSRRNGSDGAAGRSHDVFTQFLQYAKLRNVESLKFPALRIIFFFRRSTPSFRTQRQQVENLFRHDALHNGYGVTECSPNIAQTVAWASSAQRHF
jgi:long-chain acyl-CoA synthetase